MHWRWPIGRWSEYKLGLLNSYTLGGEGGLTYGTKLLILSGPQYFLMFVCLYCRYSKGILTTTITRRTCLILHLTPATFVSSPGRGTNASPSARSCWAARRFLTPGSSRTVKARVLPPLRKKITCRLYKYSIVFLRYCCKILHYFAYESTAYYKNYGFQPFFSWLQSNVWNAIFRWYK